MNRYILPLLFSIGLTSLVQADTARFPDVMDLSGTWKFQFDIANYGKTRVSGLYQRDLNDTIQLPGTTDEAGKGIQNPARHLDRLTRKYEYVGPAWYRKDIVIPQEWKNKDITLTLEMGHWEATVYVDGEEAGKDERLSTPNRFNLSKQLTPGQHALTICMDNRLKYPMDTNCWNHALTENTQTNWNGIVGEISLTAREKNNVRKVKVSPRIKDKKVQIETTLNVGAPQTPEGTLTYTLREKNGKVVATDSQPVTLTKTGQMVSHDLTVGDQMKLWDDIDPHLYDLDIVWTQKDQAAVSDRKTISFGMREVAQGKHHIQLNGRNIHLRGTVDNAVFPLTGYPSPKTEDWEKIMKTLKSYGLNHMRFHSWCPPRAAFEAADKLGFYFQVELPLWVRDVGAHPDRRLFFEKEMYAILDEYGNHPSFVLMCNGNELMGDYTVLEDYIKKGQAYDSRHLYSVATARKHVPSDQFYTSHVTPKGAITVSEGKPSTNWDRSKESDFDVPVIAHESGQRCMYPNFDEMKKYTGVLQPRNFEIFRDRLEANGMLAQAQDFFEATGAHTVLQYKEVTEALLRTSNSGGFQMLGLSDYPGQGSAFVGILDSFWESKGLVTPEKYREFCAPTVLLCRLPQRAYTPGDTVEAQFEIYNYDNKEQPAGNLDWSLTDASGKTLQKGALPMDVTPVSSVKSIGNVKIPLTGIDKAQKLTLNVQKASLYNSWDIWVFPDNAQKKEPEKQDFLFSREWNEPVKQALAAGKKVLLIPDKVPSRKTRFAGFFWNPIMFRWDPFIIGTLIQNSHPALSGFPTEKYADWQWWDILNNCRAVDLTQFRDLTPVIQSIDTYEFNRKLGIAFEANVDKGKLFVLCLDDKKDMDKRPASRQLLDSVKSYLDSDCFAPASTAKFSQLDALFGDTPVKPLDQKNDSTTETFFNK